MRVCKPHCDTCIHSDCPRDMDEVKLCGFLLACGVDFARIKPKLSNRNGDKPKLDNGNKHQGVEYENKR